MPEWVDDLRMAVVRCAVDDLMNGIMHIQRKNAAGTGAAPRRKKQCHGTDGSAEDRIMERYAAAREFLLSDDLRFFTSLDGATLIRKAKELCSWETEPVRSPAGGAYAVASRPGRVSCYAGRNTAARPAGMSAYGRAAKRTEVQRQ